MCDNKEKRRQTYLKDHMLNIYMSSKINLLNKNKFNYK